MKKKEAEKYCYRLVDKDGDEDWSDFGSLDNIKSELEETFFPDGPKKGERAYIYEMAEVPFKFVVVNDSADGNEIKDCKIILENELSESKKKVKKKKALNNTRRKK